MLLLLLLLLLLRAIKSCHDDVFSCTAELSLISIVMCEADS